MSRAVEEFDYPKWMAGLPWVLTSKGLLQPTSIMNVRVMISNHPDTQNMLSYNAFADQIMVHHGLPGDRRNYYPRPLRDEDETSVTCWLSSQYGISSSIQTVGRVMREIAMHHETDPLKAWISTLKWDKKPRIGRWLITYAGAEDDEYSGMVGQKFLIGAVARAMDPGAKVDTMPVLEGPQGLKKSALIRALAGEEFFSDQLGDVRSKEAAELIQGRWIVEVAEMDRVLRVESSSVKDFLSKREDRYRPPYAKLPVDRKRRTVFIGTINPMQGVNYLKDPTGARRFWPIKCTSIDLVAMERDREQLWAEALHHFWAGTHWWLNDEETKVALPEQEARFDEDVWKSNVEEFIRDRQANHEVSFTSSALLRALGVETGKQEQKHKLRIANILTHMGVKQGQGRDDGGLKIRVWKI